MMARTPVTDKPPRWAEQLLRALLNPRDRDTIAGDLLEEYREVILPTRGRIRAQLWYLRQALSLVHGVKLGIVVGAVFGVWNLLFTWIAPLAEDSPIALAGFYGPMFVIWGFAGFTAYRRTNRLSEAVKVGATVAFATFVVFDASAIVRVNLFLDTISQRSDWQNLVSNYQASDFESLRSYANYVYLTGAYLKILIASVIGAVSGLIGGLVGCVGRTNTRVLPSP
jgi:hypothetical protein